MRAVPVTDESLREAGEILRSGGTVVFPTETAYGLGADPLSPHGVASIFTIKGRDDGKPLPLIAADRLQVDMLAHVPDEASTLAERWPAALTLVLPTAFPDDQDARAALVRVCGGGSTVGIRVSTSPIARRLAKALGRPIIATSANRSGAPTCYDTQSVLEQFASQPQPDLILDGGTLAPTAPSTIVGFKDGTPIVLRQGPVTV